MKTVEIYNTEDDGYQIIYIDGAFYDAIHFNDDPFGRSIATLLTCLGHDTHWLHHDDIPEHYIEELAEKDLLDDVTL